MVERSGPNSPHSIGFTNVLFDLFGPRLALGHASRAEALLPLEPYGRGKDLSLAADHYLHRAFDAEEAVHCFRRHWSSHATGTRPVLVQERTMRGRVRRARSQSRKKM